MKPKHLTPRQVAALTGISADTLIRRANAGALDPAPVNVGTGERKHWRFRPETVAALLPAFSPRPGLLAAPLPHPCA